MKKLLFIFVAFSSTILGYNYTTIINITDSHIDATVYLANGLIAAFEVPAYNTRNQNHGAVCIKSIRIQAKNGILAGKEVVYALPLEDRCRSIQLTVSDFIGMRDHRWGHHLDISE